MTGRHLDGKGKGEFVYDYKYDILTFKTKNRNYKQSFEFQNFVLDVDEEKFITGIRIFDASKVFDVDKVVLKNVTYWEFNAAIEDNKIMVQFKFTCNIRNKNRVFPAENFTQNISEVSPVKMADATLGPITAQINA